MTVSRTVTMVTLNAGRGVTTARFAERIRFVLDRLPGGPRVIGFQEIDEADGPDEHALLRDMLPPSADRVGWATREPIVVSRDLDVVDEHVTPACKGLPGWTPDRSITEAVIDVGLGPELAVLNLHPPINRPQTRSRRRKVRRVLRRRVRWHVRRGHTVVITADENDVRPPLTHRRERSAVSAGLDHIRWVPAPGGLWVRVVRTGSVNTGIDGHDAHYAVLDLTTTKETP